MLSLQILVVALFGGAFAFGTSKSWKMMMDDDECVVNDLEFGGTSRSPCMSRSVNPADACRQFCQQRFGSDLINATCSGPENANVRQAQPGPSAQSECKCTTSCSIAMVDGDPHYRSFDGRWMHFQGTCKHTLIKTTGKLRGIPAFEINMKNYKKYDSDTMAYPDTVELKIPSWGRTIELDRTGKAKVDGRDVTLPFQASSSKSPSKAIYIESDGTYAVVSTSFGVSIKRRLSTWNNIVTVRVPQMPQLKTGLTGILGNNDDDKSNDNVDAAGRNRNLQSSVDAVEYGNSWCLDQTEAQPEGIINAQSKRQRSTMNSCRTDRNKTSTLNKCNQLESLDLSKCKRDIDTNSIIESCLMDACFAKTPEQTQQAVCTSVQVINTLCGLKLPCA